MTSTYTRPTVRRGRLRRAVCAVAGHRWVTYTDANRVDGYIVGIFGPLPTTACVRCRLNYMDRRR